MSNMNPQQNPYPQNQNPYSQSQAPYQQNQNPYSQQGQQTYAQPAPNPYAYQQPQYQQAPAPAYTDTMSIGSWIGTLILTCIPLVGLICMIVWACSSDPAKKSRKNWAIAQLIIAAIAIVLTIILTVVAGASLAAIFGSLMR